MQGRRKMHQEWLNQKILLDEEPHRDLHFHERDIWWASLGQNIGHEIDGKNSDSSRPVLILKRHSSTMCLILPLTTRLKPGAHYQFPIKINGTKSAVLFEQSRSISSKRLLNYVSKAEPEVFSKIKQRYGDMI